ncbi:MAG: IPT/TIG domain-containing protein [Acidobacteria bacterium]|nr:IPT/TIG domain-containing protein [Acidobacteriota bacterium]
MAPTFPAARITSIQPQWATEGGRVTIEGSDFNINGQLPQVLIGSAEARVVCASARTLAIVVPSRLEGGRTPIRIGDVPGETAFLEVGTAIATGVHQVDNPVFDSDGNLYVTFSGTRGQQAPISIFRIKPGGMREPFATGITNATSMAFGPDGKLYVSSRFEGTVYRVNDRGEVEPVATDLGVACGLAFGEDGHLFVGDRSGTIFRIAPSGRTTAFATLPPSVAAFHLAFGPGGLYATGPTLAPCDSVYRIGSDGRVDTVYSAFGRPQGLAFDSLGLLYVIEALAGVTGLYRLPTDRPPERVLAGAGLVGVAFDPGGGLVVASNDTVYRLDIPIRPHA